MSHPACRTIANKTRHPSDFEQRRPFQSKKRCLFIISSVTRWKEEEEQTRPLQPCLAAEFDLRMLMMACCDVMLTGWRAVAASILNFSQGVTEYSRSTISLLQSIFMFLTRWRPLVATVIIMTAKEEVMWGSIKSDTWGGGRAGIKVVWNQK